VKGDVENNLARADAVLLKACPKDLDVLVLPEMAFTGETTEHRVYHSYPPLIPDRI